jgi:hypothetical protein
LARGRTSVSERLAVHESKPVDTVDRHAERRFGVSSRMAVARRPVRSQAPIAIRRSAMGQALEAAKKAPPSRDGTRTRTRFWLRGMRRPRQGACLRRLLPPGSLACRNDSPSPAEPCLTSGRAPRSWPLHSRGFGHSSSSEGSRLLRRSSRVQIESTRTTPTTTPISTIPLRNCSKPCS